MKDALHQPVMKHEVLEFLTIKKNDWYIDATFGRGGHTRSMLQAGAKVFALDHDAAAEEYARTKFVSELESGKLIFVRENFRKISDVTKTELGQKVKGILFDFGTSVDQLKDQDRGFSFESNAELDMRMDDRSGVKAKDLLALVHEKQLADMFFELGGEEQAKGIAKAIVKQREVSPIETTQELVTLIETVKKGYRTHLHPATKVFQALRMIVNSEVENIEEAFTHILELLQPKGRIITISFHEGEDRVVKHQFRDWAEANLGEVITQKPLSPSAQEIEENNRSRSAKMRVFQKK